MTRHIHRRVLPLALASALVAAACGSNSTGLTGEVRADGSSTVYPLTTAVAEGFVKAHPDVKVAVEISGTGGGFEKFCQGETDVQNASRPITAAERQLCEQHGVTFVEVPVAHDALTVIVNAQNTWAQSMTIEDLKKLWGPTAEKEVTRWNQVRADWPDEEIRLLGPGAKSGTFDYFTEMVAGAVGASRTDYTASEDDTVIVKGVADDPHALGYVGYGYFDGNRSTLRAVAIDSGSGRAIEPSPQNVHRGVYRPLSRTLLIYVNAQSLDQPAVAEFLTFYLTKDEELVREVGGIAMTSRAYELVRQRVSARTPGTLFADGPARINDLELLLAEAR